jgi:hypothetical protein
MGFDETLYKYFNTDWLFEHFYPCLGGVALIRQGQIDQQTDTLIPIYTPKFVCGGIKIVELSEKIIKS